VLVFLHTQVTNARSEGFNRQVKHIKHAAYGFRNRANYRRSVRLHCTPSTRPARISPSPVKVEEARKYPWKRSAV
jgi:transposase